MPIITPDNASAQLRVALDVLEASRTGDASSLNSLLSDRLVSESLLPSFNGKRRNKAELIATSDSFRNSMKEMNVTLEESIESPGKVWLYLSMSATIASTKEPYLQRYLLLFDLEESGTDKKLQVTRLREFPDSVVASRAFPALWTTTKRGSSQYAINTASSTLISATDIDGSSDPAQLRFVLENLEAFRARDTDRFAATFSDDMSFRFIPPSMDNGDMSKTQYIPLIGNLFKEFTDVKIPISIDDLVTVPGRAWVLWSSTSTLAATGALYHQRHLWLFDIAERGSERKITRLRQMIDSLTALREHKNTATEFAGREVAV